MIRTPALHGLLRSPWLWLSAGLAAAYSCGLALDLMDVDAAQYASISMEMQQSGQWLQVQHRHADYLDKPPLLFWTSALSFALFGLHNWAYKLPSFLGALAGVYAVYRFCRIFYSEQTARLAAFILAACAGMLLLCNDVRTDTLLLGATACAVWLLAEPTGSRWAGIWSGIFIGLAMLAKGPIGLVVPAFAVVAHLVLSRAWRSFFRWRWLAAGAMALVLLLPMCWGLYHQFDLHPEKTVNHRTGVSGLYFYFWEQSFGRITGENVWKNDTSPFYFLHVYLWAFLPWPLLLVAALWNRISTLSQQQFRLPAGEEAYSLGAFLLSFAALSLSKYKLPHYIFVTLPWAAVLLARWLSLAAPRALALAETVQKLVYGLLLAACCLLLGFVFTTKNPLWWALVLGLFGLVAISNWKKILPGGPEGLVLRGGLAFVAVALVLNAHFYPNLLPYQSTAA
ncbi:MAG: glycosyltransferase family 39 protein, partial [Saprospiraceae bacterium]|nr:glycosyltransferase family 39 protein [Saprospiraceae bacterium]